MEDNSLNELAAQYKQLEQYSGSKDPITNPGGRHSKTLFFRYGLYILFFLWVLILIIALQPSYLYKKNDETNKYDFMWKKFFSTLVIVYLSLIVLYLGFSYYAPKKNGLIKSE